MFNPRAFVSILVFCGFGAIVYHVAVNSIGYFPYDNAGFVLLVASFVATWCFMDYIWPKDHSRPASSDSLNPDPKVDSGQTTQQNEGNV